MSKSVKKNFGYNLILTFCSYLFPLITYPYISRVLGVDKIGTCNFVDGLINYFVLFSMLGIGSFGVREIAKCGDNINRRNTIFSNLLFLNGIGTIVTSLILVGCTLWLPSLASYKQFLWVGLLKLLVNMFQVEWFFQGLQEFKYITIRSVFFRCLYVIGIFVFVHTQNDVFIYYLLSSSLVFASAIVNWNYSRKYRKFVLSEIRPKNYIAPVLSFGYYRILTSMYTSFNVVFLGFVTNDTQVGYFTTATKLYSLIMGVFTAFTTVMVPKVSELLANGEIEKLQDVANKTFSLLSMVALPVIFLSLFCADDIILILSGSGFEGAYTPFRIVIFLLLIIGMEQIVIQQFLMASNSNKSILSVSTIGAVVGILLNVTLTPKFGAIGSAISWGLSELCVLLVGVRLMKKHVSVVINYRNLATDISWALLYILPLLIIFFLGLSTWMNLIVSSISTACIFLIINIWINRNEMIIQGINKLFHINLRIQ